MRATLLKILNQHYFTLINLILITTFIGVSTGSGYKILTNVMDSSIVAPSQGKNKKKSVQRKSRRKMLKSYEDVAKRNLFKIALLDDLNKKDAPTEIETLDLTDLKLKLWGTIVAGDKNSRAIIEETKSRKQKLYKVGDTIQTATLKHILRNEVVLTVNGKDEKLQIERKGGSKKSRRSSSRKTSSSDMVSTSSKDIAVKRSMIDESMKNLNSLMKDVRIRPHFKNGESDGLIVSGIKSGSVFKKLGLRNGDIIMGVDGSQIESVDDAMKLYSGLKDLENMKVDIKRRGRVQTLNFNIE